MKKNILLILILMSSCVVSIIGLQLFWNYQNYQSTVKAFDHDINEALQSAVKRESNQRLELIVHRFKGWMADTTLIKVTADHNNRDSSTVFYTQDVHPKYKEDKNKKSQFGLTAFTEKLDHITPKAKAMLINHFGDKIVKRDLEQGVVYYYTQMLGDSLQAAFNSSRMNPVEMNKLLGQELKTRSIHTQFVLNSGGNTNLYLSSKVNTSLRKPFQKEFITAAFESPNTYFFKEMRLIIITSLLLIIITIGCFYYTVSTLLSQHKLAELKESFINNMTHELNTPIASIKITAEALKAFKHTPDTQLEYLNIIAHQANKLETLTDSILNTKRINHRTGKDPVLVDLNDLVVNAIRDLKPQIDDGHAVIGYEFPNSPICVPGDAESLGNILLNLIDNALKYNLKDAVVNIALKKSSDYAEISISDNGIGIPDEYHESIFERFFRVPQGNLHDVKGFGLGLSYVYEVIQQHHGEIRVVNNAPSGSTFTVKLPL